MDKIIITATAFGMKHTIELNDDAGIEDFFTAFPEHEDMRPYIT